MSSVLEDLKRRQEAGELSQEYAEGLAQFYKEVLDKYNGDEEAAKKAIARWLGNRVRAARQAKQPKRPERPMVPTGEPIYTMLYGFIVGIATPFLLLNTDQIDWRIAWSSPLWPAAIAIFYTLTTSLGWPSWAVLVLLRHKLIVAYVSAGVGAALVTGYLFLALLGFVAWPR